MTRSFMSGREAVAPLPVAGVSRVPTPHLGARAGDEPGAPLTPSILAALAALAECGDYKTAAGRLGISHNHLKNLVASAHARTATGTTIETYRALGWLRVPKELAA